MEASAKPRSPQQFIFLHCVIVKDLYHYGFISLRVCLQERAIVSSDSSNMNMMNILMANERIMLYN